MQLFQGNRQIHIQCLVHEPASVGILVDTSGSMESKLTQAKAAVTDFVNDLDLRDDIFLFAFSSHPYLLQEPTTRHGLVLRRTGLFYARGETALYDTIIDGLLMVTHGSYESKALFVVSDGYDDSSKWHKQDVLNQARRRHIPIYSIGIGSQNTAQHTWLIRTFSRDSSGLDMSGLSDLAKWTGAEADQVAIQGDAGRLKLDTARIAAAIANTYTVGFGHIKAGGGSLALQLRNHPDATVRLLPAPASVLNAPGAAPQTYTQVEVRQ